MNREYEQRRMERPFVYTRLGQDGESTVTLHVDQHAAISRIDNRRK